MSLGLAAQRDVLQSHAMSIGHLERVGAHETTNPPGRGLHAQILLGPFGPAQRGSGLSATTARVQWLVRLMCSMDREPKDDIDIDLGEAAAALLAAYSADYTLGAPTDPDIRHIDLMGIYGLPMGAQPGYLPMDGGALYRVVDLTVPVIINDAWSQSP